MKKFLKVLLLIVIAFTLTTRVYAKTYKDVVKDITGDSDTYNIDGKINLYLFHSSTCPHCKEEISFLETLEPKYKKYLNIYMYEVSDSTNSSYLEQAKKKLAISSTGVPFTVIGSKSYVGFSSSIGRSMLQTIDKYIKEYESENDTNAALKEKKEDVLKIMDHYIAAGGSKTDEVYKEVEEKLNNLTEENMDELDTEKLENSIKTLPIIGEVVLKRVSIPLAALVLGLIDGFNPCAMWVLLFLINMLFNMKDRKRMWILGFAFLFTSAFVYFLSMLGINFITSYTNIIYIRILIALVALVGGILNINSYIKTKDDGCTVVDDKKRSKIFERIRKFTSEKSFILSLVGVIALAASVNMVELACSLGFPMIFNEILSINNLSMVQSILYILLYILFFLIDDIVVFVIAMTTLKLTGISTKYNRLSHLVGGIVMIIIGLLLIFNPNILMFNF